MKARLFGIFLALVCSLSTHAAKPDPHSLAIKNARLGAKYGVGAGLLAVGLLTVKDYLLDSASIPGGPRLSGLKGVAAGLILGPAMFSAFGYLGFIRFDELEDYLNSEKDFQ